MAQPTPLPLLSSPRPTMLATSLSTTTLALLRHRLPHRQPHRHPRRHSRNHPRHSRHPHCHPRNHPRRHARHARRRDRRAWRGEHGETQPGQAVWPACLAWLRDSKGVRGSKGTPRGRRSLGTLAAETQRPLLADLSTGSTHSQLLPRPRRPAISGLFILRIAPRSAELGPATSGLARVSTFSSARVPQGSKE